MDKGSKPFFAGRFMRASFDKVKAITGGRMIILDESPWAEIADDSDGHRERKGYMKYSRVFVTRIKGHAWILAFGEAVGGYPADPYGNDITALHLGRERVFDTDQEFLKEVSEKLGESEYFSNSLILTMSSGAMSFNKPSSWFNYAMPAIRDIAPQLVAEDPKFDREHLSLSTLSPIVTSSAKYNVAAPKMLAEKLVEVLTAAGQAKK